MNWIDVGLAALVLISVACGIREGLSRTGFGLAAGVLAFLAASWLYPTEPKQFLFAFVLLICTSAAGGWLLGKWLQKEGPKWLDGVLGGMFGLANGLLVAVFAALVLLVFAPRLPREYVARSSAGPYLAKAACVMAELVPEEMKSRAERSYQELEGVLPPRFRKAVPPLSPREI